jgi:uncharacterized membrane protein (DUF2068 family)
LAVSASTGSADGRALPWIAAERGVRGVLLLAVGAVLVSHSHADWGRAISSVARHVGLDPSQTAVLKAQTRAGRLTPEKLRIYGSIAIGYGLLEACESYGLFRRRRWGEYLTVVATSVLLIPEIVEIAQQPTTFKVVAFVLNVAIVVYLAARLRRRS